GICYSGIPAKTSESLQMVFGRGDGKGPDWRYCAQGSIGAAEGHQGIAGTQDSLGNSSVGVVPDLESRSRSGWLHFTAQRCLY
ncbi:hypothetical protein RRG08_015181, partial [Elysia crispata]